MVSYTFDMLLDSQLNSVNGQAQFGPACTSPIMGGSFAHLRAQWQPTAPAIRMDKGFGLASTGLDSLGLVGIVVETGIAGNGTTGLLNGTHTFNKFDSGKNSRFIELYASPPDSRWRDRGGTTRG